MLIPETAGGSSPPLNTTVTNLFLKSKFAKLFVVRYVIELEGSAWKIWRAPGEDWNGPHGPGFNQRFIGEISADGKSIQGRWERSMGGAGDEWEIDFPISYVRK